MLNTLIKVSVTPDAPFGRSAFVVQIATDSPAQPGLLVEIPCIKGLIATPTPLNFGTLHNSTRSVSRIVALSRARGDFRVRKVETDDSHISARLVESPIGRRLYIVYRGGAEPGLHEAVLRIETDDPQQPTLEIPTLYRIEPSAKSPATHPPTP